MIKKKIKIPKFKSEDQERAFWAKEDLSKHFKSDDFKTVSLPNLKPTSRPISIRIPEYSLMRIKEKANEMGMPYQSLIKDFIAKGIEPKE